MAFAFLVAACALLGWSLSARLWAREASRGALATQAGPFERATSAGLLAAAACVSLNWTLSLAQMFTRGALLAGAVALAATGAWMAWRFGEAGAGRASTPGTDGWRVTALALLPFLAWTAYVLWRGTVIPPASEDAVIYHLPKAVLLARHHGFAFFDAPDFRIATFPANYELLLADVLLLDGSDRFTSAISLLSWILFAVSGGALAERWWGAGRALALGAALLVAGTPVAILHSGELKQDLLSAFFGVAAFLWFGRWISEGSSAAGILGLVALAIGAGTKVPFACVLVGIAGAALFAVVRNPCVRRRFTPRFLSRAALLGVVCALLLGGAAYVANLVHTGSLLGGNPAGTPPVLMRPGTVDLASLWQLPYLLLAAPFSGNPTGVWAPWAHEYWFWVANYPEQSHYGAAFTLLVLAAPFVAVYTRRRDPAPERRGERRLVSAAIAIAFFFPCFVPQPLTGFYGYFPRYLIFVTPAIACWSVVPLLQSLGRRAPLGAAALVLGASALFTVQATTFGLSDLFAPLGYVRELARHPGLRVSFYMPNRAEEALDRLAGPRDPVAVHGGHESWLYPAFGASLARPVTFLKVDASGTAHIPQDVLWVAVDRMSNVLWGAPGLHDIGRALDYLWKGTPSAEDLAVFRQLSGDPRWRLLFHDPSRNQALFMRVDRPGRPQ